MTKFNYAIETLEKGISATIFPRGNSMSPLLKDKEKVRLLPLDGCFGKIVPRVGNIVLCKVKGRVLLHKITAIDSNGRYQISNNKGHINGWTKTIYGIVDL